VRIVHILKFHNTLCLLCTQSNSLAKDALLHGRKVVRKEGDKFHHKICCVPKGCTVEGFVDEVNSNALMFVGNFHMNCPHDLALGLDRRGGMLGSPVARGGIALGVLEPSQMFLNWKQQ